jgi:hypothetical protein
MATAAAAADRFVQCPWCSRLCTKDSACNWVTCGLTKDAAGKDVFQIEFGCGRQWCFTCGRKLCTALYDATSGTRHAGARTSHTADCCRAETGFSTSQYCGGGHNSHTAARWSAEIAPDVDLATITKED